MVQLCGPFGRITWRVTRGILVTLDLKSPIGANIFLLTLVLHNYFNFLIIPNLPSEIKNSA